GTYVFYRVVSSYDEFPSSSARLSKCRCSSSAVAKPPKKKHSISKVRLLGWRAVLRLTSRLAIKAAYTWIVTPLRLVLSRCRHPRIHLSHLKNISIHHRYLYPSATSSASSSSRSVHKSTTSDPPPAPSSSRPVHKTPPPAPPPRLGPSTPPSRTGRPTSSLCLAVPSRLATTSRTTPAARAWALRGLSWPRLNAASSFSLAMNDEPACRISPSKR